MNDEPRKKPSSYLSSQMPGMRTVPSANSLLGQPKIIEKKLSEGPPHHLIGISKEKENDKLINLERKGPKQHIDEYEDKTRKNSNVLNFKTLNKYNSNANPTNPPADNKRKDKKDKEPPVRADQKEIRIGEAISINFNIQNMIQTKKAELKNDRNESDRSNITNEDKERRRDRQDKKKKKPKTNEFGLEDFQCEEVIEVPMKSTRVTAKMETVGRYQQKDNPTVLKNPIQFARNQRNYQSEIKEFQTHQQEYDMGTQTEELLFLSSREGLYFPDPYYIEKKQRNFTWYMRAVLAEWMMHVNSEYLLKRDTYHVAVVLSDLYFSKYPNIQKGDLQLVGAAAMYIAAKLQQQQPLPVAKFATSTSGKYTTNTILDMETKICKVLKWQLNPPTIYMWANRIMLQWDTYLEENQYARSHPLFRQREPVNFKKTDQRSYMNFREMMQLVDCCILDIQSFQYKPKLLVCSFLYLVIGKQLGEFPVKKITTQFPSSSRYLVDQKSIFNDLYRNFVEFTFGFMLFDLLPTVQYCATYFILPMSFEGPSLKQSDDSKNMNIEEYTSYQTYNCHTLATIRKRNRGI